MKIYTRTGDTGETSLFDGTRVRKDDPRVDAYGEVDELNAWLGLVARRRALDAGHRREIAARSSAISSRSAPSSPIPVEKLAPRVEKAVIADAHVERLEQLIDRLEATLPPLRRFILAGGTPAGAALHVARTVCRRAERRIVSLRPTSRSGAGPLREPAVRPAVRAGPRRESPGPRSGNRVVTEGGLSVHAFRNRVRHA